MRIVLVLFVCLLLTAVPLFVVQADETSSVEAEVLFTARCAMCHQLPEPGMLKPKQWKLILGTMQQRMRQANLPQLQAQESEMILEYLTARARQE